MTPKADSSDVWNVDNYGELRSYGLSSSRMVRPVLELSKSADITKVS